MTKSISWILIGLLALMTGNSCDNRGSIDTKQRNVPTFSVDMSIIRDLTTGKNMVDAYFERNGISFSDAVIKVGEMMVPSMGGGLYFVNSSQFTILPGQLNIVFESPEDEYSSIVPIVMPGDFAITSMVPRYNSNADNVYMEWSTSEGATQYLLAVSTTNPANDGTTPLTTILSGTANSFTIPDTTFEDFYGDPVAAYYYVYLIAYNEGFGPYQGINFIVPDSLPVKFLNNPSGTLRFGTIAAIDSIFVPF